LLIVEPLFFKDDPFGFYNQNFEPAGEPGCPAAGS